jgi:predicted Zn-dependent protease
MLVAPLFQNSALSLRLVLVALSFALLAACQSVQTTNAGAVGVTRKQNMAISAQEIEAQSAKEYSALVAQAAQKGELSKDTALVNRVRTISNRLIAQVGVFRPDARNWKWEVNVFNSDDVNAFCMAGGKIGVYTGLIRQLKATDDELAAVIGHEIAHALREHVREQVSDQMAGQIGLNIGTQILGAVTGNTAILQAAQQLGPVLMQTTFSLPRSRQAEIEADQMGVELAARAGYNPRAAITLWQKMAQLGGSPPEFLSTHPSASTRIQELEAAAKKVQHLYKP